MADNFVRCHANLADARNRRTNSVGEAESDISGGGPLVEGPHFTERADGDGTVR
jgi:hypothetical protein